MAGLIHDSVLDQVRHANDVVDVISTYFPLKRAGANFRALCPFHKEKTPSFNVSPSKQIWHCFGCGKGGDVFKFVMEYESLDFITVVQRLAERGGIRLELEERPGAPSRDEKEQLLQLHERVTEFFHVNLLQDPAAEIARAYTRQRAMGDATLKRWRLGYSPDGWDGLIQWARAQKFPAGLLATAGLVVRSESGDRVYDRFRGRLMFPVRDDQGRVIGFSGRILTDAKDQPKYVNSPETPLFHKGRILFAFDKAKRAILDDKYAVICEGQIDTISCHEAGLSNVVAPQGTALTDDHARLLKRYTDEVVLMFDADTAGQNAAVRNAEPLWNSGFAIRVALLPVGHDPDSYLKEHGLDALRQILERAAGFFDFLLDRLSRDHDPRSERGKLRIAQGMVEWLCRLRDPILEASFTQKTAARLGVREEVIRQVMQQHRQRDKFREPVEEETETAELPPAAAPAEEMLLRLILHDERILKSLHARLDQKWLSGALAGELVRRVMGLDAAGEWRGATTLLAKQDDEGMVTYISRILLDRLPEPDRLERAAAECLKALEGKWVEREYQRLKQRMSQPGLGFEEQMNVQRQVLDLRRKMDHIT